MEFQEIAAFLSKFYIWEILIMLLAIGLTFIFKIPIKKKAYKLQEKYGVDKSMLTWITAIIPYVLCLIMVFFLYWYRAGFSEKLDSLEYTSIITEGILLGSGAIGLYEAVKKIVKGQKAIHEKKLNIKIEKIEAQKREEAQKKTSPYRVKEK